MVQFMIILAVSLAAYAGASVWALLCGSAALSLLSITGEGVMTRVLATGDEDVVHYSLRQIAADAFWASGAAYMLGLILRFVVTG